MNFSKKKVLILAPHTDDAEIGMGGTINKMIHNYGCEVRIIVFSTCEESLPPGFPAGTLRHEFFSAAATFGLAEDALTVHDYPVRNFDRHRQDILEGLIAFKKEYQPDLIFIPSRDDIHQDHSVINREGIRAFKDKTLLGYELYWNSFEFKSQFFSTLSQADMEQKHKAVNCYKSQAFRNYGDGQLLVELAKVRGAQVKSSYAECFEIIRVVW